MNEAVDIHKNITTGVRKKVFITGPDGLLGSNVVRELVARHYEVVALVQRGKTPLGIKGVDVRIVYGDITNAAEVIELSKGSNYFIHLAAITDLWPSRGEHYFKVNVEGTINAIEAALLNKVERFIHIGSASTFGYGSLEQPGNEMSSYTSFKYNLDYIESKKKGQELVLQAVRERKLPALVLCPTFMIGPYDTRPSSGAIVLAIAKKKLPALAKGGKNWVAAKDVAVGICNALERGTIGASYILGGENLSFKDAVKRMANALGQKDYPKTEMPNAVIKGLGWMSTAAAKLTGIPPVLSFPMAVIACDGHYFSPEKAIKELDLPQTPIEEATKELHQWFKENNYL